MSEICHFMGRVSVNRSVWSHTQKQYYSTGPSRLTRKSSLQLWQLGIETSTVIKSYQCTICLKLLFTCDWCTENGSAHFFCSFSKPVMYIFMWWWHTVSPLSVNERPHLHSSNLFSSTERSTMGVKPTCRHSLFWWHSSARDKPMVHWHNSDVAMTTALRNDLCKNNFI